MLTNNKLRSFTNGSYKNLDLAAHKKEIDCKDNCRRYTDFFVIKELLILSCFSQRTNYRYLSLIKT